MCTGFDVSYARGRKQGEWRWFQELRGSEAGRWKCSKGQPSIGAALHRGSAHLYLSWLFHRPMLMYLWTNEGWLRVKKMVSEYHCPLVPSKHPGEGGWLEQMWQMTNGDSAPLGAQLWQSYWCPHSQNPDRKTPKSCDTAWCRALDSTSHRKEYCGLQRRAQPSESASHHLRTLTFCPYLSDVKSED